MNKQQIKEALMVKFEGMLDEAMKGYTEFTHTDVIVEVVAEDNDNEATVTVTLGIEDMNDKPEVYAHSKRTSVVDTNTDIEDELEETVTEIDFMEE